MAMALDQYTLEVIVVSVFAIIDAIYRFVAVKKKVAGEVWTQAVNYVAADADVIIVGAGVTDSALAHTFGKVRQILHFFLFFLSQ